MPQTDFRAHKYLICEFSYGPKHGVWGEPIGIFFDIEAENFKWDGPYSFEDFRELVREGKVKHNDVIRVYDPTAKKHVDYPQASHTDAYKCIIKEKQLSDGNNELDGNNEFGLFKNGWWLACLLVFLISTFVLVLIIADYNEGLKREKELEIARAAEASGLSVEEYKKKKAEESERIKAEQAEIARNKREDDARRKVEQKIRAKAEAEVAERLAKKRKANATNADGLPKDPIASFKFFAVEQIDLLKKMQTTGGKKGSNIWLIDGNYSYDIKKTDSIVSPLIGHLTIKIEFKPRYKFEDRTEEYWVTAEIDGMSPWWTETKEWGQLRGDIVIKKCVPSPSTGSTRIIAKRMVGLEIPFKDLTDEEGLKAKLMFEALR